MSAKTSLKQAASPSVPKLSKRQKFVIERINRKTIKNAPYNPRTIDTHARKKLGANLKKVGLLQPIIVNRTTMHILGGHQRLAALDVLEGTDNYLLDVSMVEMTLEQEKAQNIFLNNPAAMGTWDLDALGSMMKEMEIEELESTGFDKMDVEVMFEDDELASHFDVEQQAEEVKETIDDIEKIANLKKAKKEGLKKAREVQDTEVYAIVVFKDRKEQTEFMRVCGADPDGKYVDAAALWRLLGRKTVTEVKEKLSAFASAKPKKVA